MTSYEFKGWAGLDEKACEGKLNYQAFEPKKWDEDDVDVKVLYCGICGSDASALAGEWGSLKDVTPQVCGHEIVGEVVKVGSKVEHGLKVGQLVGIGAQSDCCRECEWCNNGEENFCPKQTITFNTPFNRGNGKGCKAHGGFSDYWRGPSRFAIPLPDGLDPAHAAPMLCGGVTVFSPLQRFGAGTKAKNVGVMGVGGLGHFAIIFAKAMGAEVTAISRSDAKKEDAMKLGASKYIASGSNAKEGIAGHEKSLDLIICTINPPEFPITDYLALLKPKGTFVLVGIVPTPLQVSAASLIMGNISIAGSNIGAPNDIKAMLDFSVKHQIQPWINKWEMDKINEAMPAFKRGEPKYRFVLVNTGNGGKM